MLTFNVTYLQRFYFKLQIPLKWRISPLYTRKTKQRLKITIDVSVFSHAYRKYCRYMDSCLSGYLCGFREGYSTQHCFILMLEKWRKDLDKRNLAGALLTDLS